MVCIRIGYIYLYKLESGMSDVKIQNNLLTIFIFNQNNL